MTGRRSADGFVAASSYCCKVERYYHKNKGEYLRSHWLLNQGSAPHRPMGWASYQTPRSLERWQGIWCRTCSNGFKRPGVGLEGTPRQHLTEPFPQLASGDLFPAPSHNLANAITRVALDGGLWASDLGGSSTVWSCIAPGSTSSIKFHPLWSPANFKLSIFHLLAKSAFPFAGLSQYIVDVY